MISKYFMALCLIISFAAPAMAEAATRCHWTVEGTNTDFASDPVYKLPPVMTAASACGSSAVTLEPGAVKPVCTGFIYCESQNPVEPPRAANVGCFAVKVNSKWMCPSAQACMDDADVQVDRIAKAPAPRTTAPATGRPTAPGSTVNEGVSGR